MTLNRPKRARRDATSGFIAQASTGGSARRIRWISYPPLMTSRSVFPNSSAASGPFAVTMRPSRVTASPV